jgi:signal transduction histidine kinase/CheY-like chemotaxis protein
LLPGALRSAWQDRSAGLPPIEIASAKVMGSDADKSVILQDDLGRIFVGSGSLLVFDGQSWTAHAKTSDHLLISLVRGKDGILWGTARGELGFFQEETLGVFKFHSLLSHLPESARNVGVVWGCAPIGTVTYFFCTDKLLRWDGRAFQVLPFPTKQQRLSVVKAGDEYWLQHLETGLYKLSENAPELQFTADQLPTPFIMGLFRDEAGIVVVSNAGLHRPGHPSPISPPELNHYLTQQRVSSFTELADGNIVIGTLFGGLVLADQSGKIIRTWSDSASGLPGRTVIGLAAGSSGRVLGTTPTDFFSFAATGNVTVFNVLNGLRGEVINSFAFCEGVMFAATDDGTYRLSVSANGQAQFESVPALAARYSHMVAHGEGLLLAKFGGVDWFDGRTTRPAYGVSANAAVHITPVRAEPGAFYVTELTGIARLVQKPDGSFERNRFLELPDRATSLHEDSVGRLWIGTSVQGAFVYDPATRELLPVKDPATGQPIAGLAQIMGNDQRLLLFLNGRVLQAGPHGQSLRVVSGLPPINPSAVAARAGTDEVLVAYLRPSVISGPLHGAGVISFAADGSASWRELSLPSLDAIGSIRAATFSEEDGHPVLWLGGMEGILRLDYEKIPTLSPPNAPLIKLAGAARNFSDAGGMPHFPFKGHHLRFQVFTGDYFQSKHWLFQSRLGDGSGTWSTPSSSRSFEYSNLSEGIYRFEVRALNTAGVPSVPSVFTFRILPPWYRSTQAYFGYGVVLLIAVFAFIRIRERRIRVRNQELESLVNVRTAELVKANAAKDEFLAGVSHEIRNPMNGVIGIAENFRTEHLDAESRRKFSLLRQCASHLSSLLEDILDFSKVQAGAIELDPKPFDLPELVESVGGITRTDSEKYGIPVELAVSPAVPRRLVGDARRIRQILINFVSNALKFSGRGQVSVTVWCKPAGAQTEVIFAVSDEGPGISAEEQARLFTRFERGAAAQKGRVPGTGLGLALCKGLAEKMGGRIWLESELGQGSCFYFSAPFTAVETAPVAAPATAAPAAARSALVVDDQEYNRIVLADLLQGMGFTVDSTQEGQAALDLAGRKAFDVIFLDFNLPGLSGVDVARGIRALPGASAHALILATTAFNTPEKRAQCLDAGMDAFLGKPVTRERLVKALAGLAPAPPAPVAEPPAPAPKKSDGPADRLGNLRLLARRKGVSVADELALYFSELDGELAQLDAAIAAENAEEAGRFSHMLCGRCSFIYERELEQVQRRVESAVAAGRWADARRDSREFAAQLAVRRVSLASSGSAAAPPA